MQVRGCRATPGEDSFLPSFLPEDPVKMPPHHLWRHTCSSIYPLHLSESVSFKSRPVCFRIVLGMYLSFDLSYHCIFHSIVTHKQTSRLSKLQACPAKPSARGELCGEWEADGLLWHTSFISPSGIIPKQKRSQTTYVAGCQFSFGEINFKKVFQTSHCQSMRCLQFE